MPCWPVASPRRAVGAGVTSMLDAARDRVRRLVALTAETATAEQKRWAPGPWATHHHHDHDAHPGGQPVEASPTSTVHSGPGATSGPTAGGVTARGSDFADLMRRVKA